MVMYDSLNFNIRLLRAVGLWPTSNHNTTLYRCFTTFITSSYLLFFTIIGLHIFTHWGSLDIVDSLSVTLTNITALIKLYTILFKRESIDKLVAFIESGYSLHNETDKNVAEIKTEIVTASRRKSRILTCAYVGLFAWTDIVWAFSPLTLQFGADMSEHVVSNMSEPELWMLPFSSWFPFDIHTSPNYEIAYAIQVVLASIEAVSIAAMDTFYMGLIIQTSSQFQILQRSVKNVKKHAVENLKAQRLQFDLDKDFIPNWGETVGAAAFPLPSSTTTDNDDAPSMSVATTTDDDVIPSKSVDTITHNVYALSRSTVANADVDERQVEMKTQTYLVKCILQHQALLKHCDKLEELMSPIIFIEFFVVSLNLCLTGFQITVVTSYNLRFLTVIGYLMCVLMQLFFLCLYGSQLLEQSLKVLDAAYESDWYRCSERFKRAVLVMIMKANRPVKLTAGKFGTLTLETFNELIQKSYSYFAVLRTLTETKNI